jgi:hypothetical protein
MPTKDELLAKLGNVNTAQGQSQDQDQNQNQVPTNCQECGNASDDLKKFGRGKSAKMLCPDCLAEAKEVEAEKKKLKEVSQPQSAIAYDPQLAEKVAHLEGIIEGFKDTIANQQPQQLGEILETIKEALANKPVETQSLDDFPDRVLRMEGYIASLQQQLSAMQNQPIQPALPEGQQPVKDEILLKEAAENKIILKEAAEALETWINKRWRKRWNTKTERTNPEHIDALKGLRIIAKIKGETDKVTKLSAEIENIERQLRGDNN